MGQPDAGRAQFETALSTAAATKDTADDNGLAIGYCPRCSARLGARSCKLICPDCGYYMSCSDFY